MFRHGHGDAIAAAHAPGPAGHYREYRPCAALAPYVRAIFLFRIHSFTGNEPGPAPSLHRQIRFHPGQPCWSSLFANAHPSIVINQGDGYRIEGKWQPHRATPHVIGPMTHACNSHHGGALAQIGAYLRPGGAAALLEAPPAELVDRVVALADIAPAPFEIDLDLHSPDAQCLARFEALLLAHLRRLASSSCTREALQPLATFAAARIHHSNGALPQRQLANEAGVSRQYLGSVFRQAFGLSPKLYSELTRFQSVLHAAGSATGWADLAARFHYTDQSHLISHFRRFTATTPSRFVRNQQFHPFVGE